MKISTRKKKHCYAVAEHMYREAEKLIEERHLNIDPNVAYTLGLLHDIGYLYGRASHELMGSELLSSMGMDSSYTKVICIHGTNPYLAYRNNIGVYALLLWDADMSVDADGNDVGYDKRLDDIMKRYGEDSTAYRTANATIDFLLHAGNPELIGCRDYCSTRAFDFKHYYEMYFTSCEPPYNVRRFASFIREMPESEKQKGVMEAICQYQAFITKAEREVKQEVER